MREFVSAVVEAEQNEEGDEKPIEFKIDGRVMHAKRPITGQLIFMMTSLGRGQNTHSRFANMVNLLLETLDEDDRVWLENRLLDGNPKTALDPDVISDVFDYLTEEWFGNPTAESSDSA